MQGDSLIRSLDSDLTAAQKKMSASPVLSCAFTGGSNPTYTTTRILKADHMEEHSSHRLELTLQDSDGVITDLDMIGWKVVPSWGMSTASGDKTSATAPLWVRNQRLQSSQGRNLATISAIGIPDRLAEDKASDDYNHDASSPKTVKELVTEVASGVAVAENTEISNLTTDSNIGLTSVENLDGAGQSFDIADTGNSDDDDFYIVSASFKLKKTGTPSGNVTFRIDDWNGASIATGELGEAAALTNSPAWYTVTWDSPELIDASEVGGGIWIWVFYDSGDVSNHVNVYYNSEPVKADQNYAIFTGSTPLINDTGKDCAYKYVVEDGSTGVGVYDHCTAWTVTDDTEGGDGLLTGNDAYLPADAFFIRQGESRLEVIDKLLAYTKTERRFESDEAIHLRVPVTSGSTYDYEYALTTGHTFFTKAIRNALVIPNKVVVESFPLDTSQYTGSYTSSASFALTEVWSFVRTKLTSDAQAVSIATANIARIEVASQRGDASVPMNAGAEIWDFVKVTDERASDSRDGNLGYLQRHYDDSSSPNAYMMTFGFGGVAIKGVIGARPSELYISPEEEAESFAKWGVLRPLLDKTINAINDIQNLKHPNLAKLKEDVNNTALQVDLYHHNVTTVEDPLVWPVADEDDMTSDSNTKLATQQSIKAYVDSNSIGLTARTIGSTIDTVYLNDTGETLFAIVSVVLNPDEDVICFVENANPPTVAHARATNLEGSATGDTITVPITFIVPDGWRYKVATNTGSPAISLWKEWSIG